MARETNAQLKKELEEARETVKDLMLKLAGMNKKANTASLSIKSLTVSLASSSSFFN